MMVPIISSNIIGTFSIAIDWITGNIYLLEKSVARIDVFTWNGQNRTNLITSNLFAPTSIVLDPIQGFLFLTDSGNTIVSKLQPAKIERGILDFFPFSLFNLFK